MTIDLMKEKSLTLKKTRSRGYFAETIINVNCTNNPVLLANAPAQAECLLHSLEQAARGIHFYMNSDKTKFM